MSHAHWVSHMRKVSLFNKEEDYMTSLLSGSPFTNLFGGCEQRRSWLYRFAGLPEHWLLAVRGKVQHVLA